jgi:hypothetical protein
VTGTAIWELENLSRYYAGRGEIAPVTVLPQPAARHVGHVVVVVPRAYPLEAPHRAELRELVHRRASRSLSFSGLTVYELGPAEVDGTAGEVQTPGSPEATEARPRHRGLPLAVARTALPAERRASRIPGRDER